jgi:hypothetical protein
MSEQPTEQLEAVSADSNGSAPLGSLHERMRSRYEQRQGERTEKFPVPGYSEYLYVELRSLGWEAIRKVTKRHERLRDEATKELYSAADQLVAATVQFWEVDKDGDPTISLEDTWTSLARATIPHFPQDGSARTALLSLIGESNRVIFLWSNWGEWSDSEKADVEEKVAEDFRTTR